MATNQQLLAAFDPLAGTRAVQPNWGMLQAPPGAMPMQNAWSAPPPPDVAAANQAAQTQQAAQMASAAQAAAAGGIQNQKDEEAVDAMAQQRYKLPTEKAKIARQFKTADAIRGLGQSLNTGSVNGGAPNWAGGIANVVGAYLGKKQQDQADAAAAALGGTEAGLASQYYRQTPTSYF
jgi:hypothetical protein